MYYFLSASQILQKMYLFSLHVYPLYRLMPIQLFSKNIQSFSSQLITTLGIFSNLYVFTSVFALLVKYEWYSLKRKDLVEQR